mgnify:CR=1 FL=1|jgi:hypothetical protein
MNTYQFFYENFGRFLTTQTNQPHMDAWRALSSTHPLQKKNKLGNEQNGRLMSGWAIIRPTGAAMQQKLAVKGIQYDDRTRFAAFVDELATWDDTPRMFLLFDKSPIPIANLFMTLDLRAVRICSPAGVETFDYTLPPSSTAGAFQRGLEKQKSKNAA